MSDPSATIESQVRYAAPPTGASLDDQRNDTRVTTSLPGTIKINDTTVDCLVRDISEGGAKIEIDQHHPIPPSFDLMVPDLKTFYRCELRWRYARAVGVKFISCEPWRVPDAGPTRDELLSENAQLKATIAALTKQLADVVPPPAKPVRKTAAKTAATTAKVPRVPKVAAEKTAAKGKKAAKTVA